MSLCSLSGNPGTVLSLPPVDTSQGEDRLFTPRSAAGLQEATYCADDDTRPCALATMASPRCLSPHTRLHSPPSPQKSGADTSRSSSCHQQSARMLRCTQQAHASVCSRRLNRGTELSAWRSALTKGKLYIRGHANSEERKATLRSSSRYRHRSGKSRISVVKATTPTHSIDTHDCAEHSSSVSLSATQTVRISTPRRGDTSLTRSSERAATHLLGHPAALTTFKPETGSAGGVAVVEGEPPGRTRGLLRTCPGGTVSTKAFPVMPSRSSGFASAPVYAETGGLLGAEARRGATGETFSNHSRKAFGGLGTTNQNRCSHCKAAEDALYRCPCGLAQYCCTTCQHAHWPFHKEVCCHGVRAAQPPTRHCDWCRTPSQTLHQCECGLALYCDTHCQRADWSNHSIVCSTETSTALATALVSGRAPRLRRESATQTAHWQMSVPVFRPTERGDGVDAIENATEVSLNLHTSLPERQGPCEKDGEENILSGSLTWLLFAGAWNAVETPQGTPRRRSHVCETSDHGLHTGANCRSSFLATLHQNRETSAPAPSNADLGSRTPTSPEAAISGGNMGTRRYDVWLAGMNSRSTHSQHNAAGTLYKILYRDTTESQQHSNKSLLDASRVGGWQPLRLTQTGELDHANTSCSLQHQRHKSFPLINHDGHVNHGSQSDFGDHSASAVASPTIRDQPGMVAYLVASRHIIEQKEMSARAAFLREFRLGCARLQMCVLRRREEEERMAILKDEVLWCVLTGNPSCQKLKQELKRFHEACR
ncbi:hypothetical protein, unknown function [Leishmania tarentolae]|uniref:MYND-type domain-containing protein n=1 Tax=Leishmania tarentolae TaxID=5689 RepID=A0A640KWR7_LEITA|nr:hypothetical protein, unknown function [Leishmania tarentolae]